GQLLAFYNIPEPASAAIEADIAKPGSMSPLVQRSAPRPDARSSPPGTDLPPPPGGFVVPEPQQGRTPHPPTDPAPPPQPDPAPPARPEPRADESNEVPTLLVPSSGGATIASFDWLDQNDDYVGTDGRRIAPGGGKHEHYRLVLDLPPASII